MTTTPRAGVVATWPSRAARLSAVVVALGAAALSFRATADVAESSGAVGPGWGWIVPLVVEAGVLTAAALAWVRSGEGLSARMETVVMAALLALSVVVNVAHASGGALGKVLAAVPPVVLLVAVEGLLREQRRTASTADRAIVWCGIPTQPLDGETPVPVPDEDTRKGAPAMTAERADLDTHGDDEPSEQVEATNLAEGPPRELEQADPVANHLGAGRPPTEEAELARLVGRANAEGQPVTGALVGAWLGVSTRTGSRRLKSLLESHPTLSEGIAPTSGELASARGRSAQRQAAGLGQPFAPGAPMWRMASTMRFVRR